MIPPNIKANANRAIIIMKNLETVKMAKKPKNQFQNNKYVKNIVNENITARMSTIFLLSC